MRAFVSSAYIEAFGGLALRQHLVGFIGRKIALRTSLHDHEWPAVRAVHPQIESFSGTKSAPESQNVEAAKT